MTKDQDRLSRLEAKSEQYVCHLLPKDEWCDRDGLGGFMGHTCEPRAELIIRRWLMLKRERQ